MPGRTAVAPYERKVTPVERIFSLSPFSVVAVVARIQGEVTHSMLSKAVSRVQQRHALLRVRIKTDNDPVPWFTSEGVEAIPVTALPRESAEHWMNVYHEECRKPFEFDKRPPVRFILIQSPVESELLIFCHHIVCDGMSLAYLARDLMSHLGNPARAVDVLPDPAPIDKENMPGELSLNPFFRYVIKRINRKWERDRVMFDQEDYRNLHEAYWLQARHRMLAVELTAAQTTAIVLRCRQEKITVNSALTAAFSGAQALVLGDRSSHPGIGIAGSVRDRLPKPAGDAMGFYAGLVNLNNRYNRKTVFWENARRLHRTVTPLFNNRQLFREPLLWCYLDPAILEAIHFKILGGLVPPHFTRYQKLSAFHKQKDVVWSLLKRKKMESLGKPIMGTAVTNLTRLDFPEQYGDLVLDRLIMNPGGAFPPAMVNLVLGAVTVAGKLSLVLEYVEDTVDTETMEKIR
ncbi:MAG: condensation domain-containing protein, partial [bacterium]